MAEKNVTVFIYLPGEPVAVPAGIFTHESDAGIGTFAYGKRYIERANALPVDPVALPLGNEPLPANANAGLYGAFRDAAPDYWGRLIIAAEKKVPPEALTEMDFLLSANATRVGNLDFRKDTRIAGACFGAAAFQSVGGFVDRRIPNRIRGGGFRASTPLIAPGNQRGRRAAQMHGGVGGTPSGSPNFRPRTTRWISPGSNAPP